MREGTPWRAEGEEGVAVVVVIQIEVKAHPSDDLHLAAVHAWRAITVKRLTSKDRGRPTNRYGCT